MKIWTLNVLTGIPEIHEAIVNGSTAVYSEEWIQITLYGGFYTDRSEAQEDNTALCLEKLRANKSYADHLYQESGIYLKGEPAVH